MNLNFKMASRSTLQSNDKKYTIFIYTNSSSSQSLRFTSIMFSEIPGKICYGETNLPYIVLLPLAHTLFKPKLKFPKRITHAFSINFLSRPWTNFQQMNFHKFGDSQNSDIPLGISQTFFQFLIRFSVTTHDTWRIFDKRIFANSVISKKATIHTEFSSFF